MSEQYIWTCESLFLLYKNPDWDQLALDYPGQVSRLNLCKNNLTYEREKYGTHLIRFILGKFNAGSILFYTVGKDEYTIPSDEKVEKLKIAYL